MTKNVLFPFKSVTRLDFGLISEQYFSDEKYIEIKV